VAVGITLIFGLTRLVNFAHGQFLILGAFITFSLTSAGLTFWLAMPLATVAVGAIGVATDVALPRRTLDHPLNGFIVSLGLVIALEGLNELLVHALDGPLLVGADRRHIAVEREPHAVAGEPRHDHGRHARRCRRRPPDRTRQTAWSWSAPWQIVCHERQVIRRMTSVIANPINGSTTGTPTATTTALAITASET
jgi:branched-subunit amino acid ABC-type transport system permease component